MTDIINIRPQQIAQALKETLPQPSSKQRKSFIEAMASVVFSPEELESNLLNIFESKEKLVSFLNKKIELSPIDHAPDKIASIGTIFFSLFNKKHEYYHTSIMSFILENHDLLDIDKNNLKTFTLLNSINLSNKKRDEIFIASFSTESKEDVEKEKQILRLLDKEPQDTKAILSSFNNEDVQNFFSYISCLENQYSMDCAIQVISHLKSCFITDFDFNCKEFSLFSYEQTKKFIISTDMRNNRGSLTSSILRYQDPDTRINFDHIEKEPSLVRDVIPRRKQDVFDP